MSHLIYGETSAGVTAAAIAIDDNVPVQKVDYQKLKNQLIKDNQIIDMK